MLRLLRRCALRVLYRGGQAVPRGNYFMYLIVVRVKTLRQSLPTRQR
jgi:hypothetical protein